MSEYLAETIQADHGYQGVIGHNPVARTRQFKTRWGRRQPSILLALPRAGGDGTLAEILRAVYNSKLSTEAPRDQHSGPG